MTAATAAITSNTTDGLIIERGTVAAATDILQGYLVMQGRSWEATYAGKVLPLDDGTANIDDYEFYGVAHEDEDTTNNRVRVKVGCLVELTFSTDPTGLEGRPAYAIDNKTCVVTKTAIAFEIGTIEEVVSTTKAKVKLHLPHSLNERGTGGLRKWPAQSITATGDLGLRINAGTLDATTGDATLQAQILRIDPGGAGRAIDLPAVAEAGGLELWITNTADAAEDLTVRLDGGGATIVTISQNEVGYIWCDGATWDGGVMAAT